MVARITTHILDILQPQYTFVDLLNRGPLIEIDNLSPEFFTLARK